MDYEKIIHTIVDPFLINPEALMIREIASTSEKDVTLLIVSENEDTARLIGKKGSMLKKIGTNARYEIEKQLEMKVNLQLWVKVRKDWRDSELLMKNYGYINEK